MKDTIFAAQEVLTRTQTLQARTVFLRDLATQREMAEAVADVEQELGTTADLAARDFHHARWAVAHRVMLDAQLRRHTSSLRDAESQLSDSQERLNRAARNEALWETLSLARIKERRYRDHQREAAALDRLVSLRAISENNR